MAAYSEILKALEDGRRVGRDCWTHGIYLYLDADSILPLIGRGDPQRDMPFMPSDGELAATDWYVIEE